MIIKIGKDEAIQGTLAIALSFVFLAYFVSPVTEGAFSKVRAYRAWRAIEKRQTVEVTNYPLVAELLRGRGKWDAARIMAVLLTTFAIASWGLELSLDLAIIGGTVTNLYLQPPPICLDPGNWKVMEQLKNTTSELSEWETLNRGKCKNDCQAKNTAMAVYDVTNGNRVRQVQGDVEVASWSDKAEDAPGVGLFYNRSGKSPTVDSLDCFENGVEKSNLTVEIGSEAWGTVLTCGHGPKPTDENSTTATLPPTILLSSFDESHTYLIVEESISYPSFLYSVWNVTSIANDKDQYELDHVFHIASTARLAEAVVTEIVYASQNKRTPTGGNCFMLLGQYSSLGAKDLCRGERAAPFGEQPTAHTLNTTLSKLENIEDGVKIDIIACVCGAWLISLASLGVVWSLCLRSSAKMDVFNRDELIRAVSLPGPVASDKPPSAMRIFVRKEDNGSMRVIISDTAEGVNGCFGFLQRGRTVVQEEDPAPVAGGVADNNGDGGAVLPAGPRTVCLEGIRTGMGRAYPGRMGNFRYPTSISLSESPVPPQAASLVGTPLPFSASPVPSQCVSLVGTPLPFSASPVPSQCVSLVGSPLPLSASATPTQCASLARAPLPPHLSPLPLVPRTATLMERGASVFFDSTHSSGSSEDPGGGGTVGRGDAQTTAAGSLTGDPPTAKSERLVRAAERGSRSDADGGCDLENILPGSTSPTRSKGVPPRCFQK